MVGGSILKFSAASTLSSNLRSLAYLTSFYRFERELEALRKELADTTGRSGRSSPTNTDAVSGGPSDEDLTTGSPLMMNKGLPLVTPDDAPVPVDDTTKKAQ
jgi:hypothetical protein